ncbi:MAG: 5-(carboxyamino)imidazole ribonucleotide mutase [Candidatus Odinarchaeia archaeon]
MGVEFPIKIIAGSKSDSHIVESVVSVLDDFKVKYEVQYISAHRDPDKLREYIRKTEDNTLVYICIAGLSAALPGVVSSYTSKPVIGVPVSAKLGGLDSLLSIVQMPPGVPVACVGIDNGKNAAYFALRILNLIRNLDKDV